MKQNVMMKKNQEKNQRTKYVDLSICMYQVRGHSESFLLNFLVMRQQRMHFENYFSFRGELFWKCTFSLVEAFCYILLPDA